MVTVPGHEVWHKVEVAEEGEQDQSIKKGKGGIHGEDSFVAR
jgi:hypothetical protein